MNLYKKNVLKHAIPMNPRRHHKYLYIDANGNYVYPEDVARKAGNKAKALNAQGQANAVNMRKERAERIKIGNDKLANRLSDINARGQANVVNARKERAEGIKAGNERVTNSAPYKIGKAIFDSSIGGKTAKRLKKHGKPVLDASANIKLPESKKVKSRQKTPEEIAREDAELEKRISEGMAEFTKQYAEDYIEQETKKKKKRSKEQAKRIAKAALNHSDIYRSNVMNSHQRKIYASQIKHGLEWKRHKYLYKDANGNYVYPEDVKNNAKSKVQGFIADQKQKHKDRVFTNTTLPEKLISKKIGRDDNKELDQISSAHKESTGRKDNSTNIVLDYIRTPHTSPSIKAKSLDKQIEKTANRKQAVRNAKSEAQRKSAHAGYEADKKNFPDGGSTEELERQKAKTHARKRLKGDEVNRFRKDPAIDNDPEVRAARKKWLGKEENDWDGKNTVTAKSAAGRSINAHKMYDSVSRTPHEGAKRRAKVKKFIEGERSGNARNEYLAARQRAAEKDYLTQTRKARETKARTEDTVERMRKKKKRSSR